MKVLLLADLQLDGGLSLGHGEYGPGSRFHDQEQMLHQIADIADQEDVELAILAGDTFDRPKPSPWSILAMQEFLERMPKVLIVSGNHDHKSLALPSVLECLARPGIRVAQKPAAFGYEDFYVSALPWQPIGAFAGDGLPTDRDELNAYVGMLLAREAEKLAQFKAVHRHILVGHWSISGGMTNTGVGVEVFREPVIPCEALANAGFDMVAFGHIHAVQVLNHEPPVLYLGSPWLGSFGEVGQPHGVWIYDCEAPEMRFVPVEDRKFASWDMDLDDGDDFSQVIEGYEPLMSQVPGAVIRIRYKGSEERCRLVDDGDIRRRLLEAGAHKVFITGTPVKRSRARVESSMDELGDEEALSLWLMTDGTSPERAARARVLHAEMLAKLQ